MGITIYPFWGTATAEQGARADSALQPNAPISSLAETATAKILTADERDVIDNLSALIAPDVTLVVARSLGAL